VRGVENVPRTKNHWQFRVDNRGEEKRDLRCYGQRGDVETSYTKAREKKGEHVGLKTAKERGGVDLSMQKGGKTGKTTADKGRPRHRLGERTLSGGRKSKGV